MSDETYARVKKMNQKRSGKVRTMRRFARFCFQPSSDADD